MDGSIPDHWNNRLRLERIRRNWHQRDMAERLGTTVVTVNRWERGVQQPGNYFRVKLCALFGKSIEELGFVPDGQQTPIQAMQEASTQVNLLTSLPSLWSIPYPRNPFFTGREDILHRLHEQFSQKQAQTQSWAISGLGGLGKTQIVLEYAYRYAQDYTAVFWINATTEESMMASFLAIADRLNRPEKRGCVVEAVMRWLTIQHNWLLIFDNVEEPAQVKNFLPAARHGSLLFTSRRQGTGLTPQTVRLDPLTIEEGTRFLLRRAGRLNPGTSPSKEVSAARAIVVAMDGLPLALDQAGAYIESTQCSLSDYTHLFQSAPLLLLDERDAHVDHPHSVTRTFTLAFEQLEQSNPSAMEVLTVCAFLAPEAIPETIFFDGAADLGTTFATLTADRLQFHCMLKALLTYSLIQRDATTHTLTIHRLVQTVLKGRLSPDARYTWIGRVIQTITHLFPSSEELQTDYWQRCEQLLPHALMCLTPGEQRGKDEALHIVLQSHVAGYLSKCAAYTTSKPLLEHRKHQWEPTLGLEHPKVTRSLNHLNLLYWHKGQYEQVRSLLKHAEEITTQQDRIPERACLCACGCGREIDTSKSRGEPRRFFSTACKQRFYRNVARRKRNTVTESTTLLPRAATQK